jgi:MEMO1 family protein
MAMRPPAVASSFHADRPERLSTAAAAFLAKAEPSPAGLAQAVIAPHAGYRYSWPVAGRAFAEVRVGHRPDALRAGSQACCGRRTMRS